MENLTHSLSKKSYRGNGFGMAAHKSVYEDVFGGPPKFGVPTLAPRLEDYSEIFGGFHSSRGLSIPVLDLPVVDEAELSFDVGNSTFDYSEVFGGFDGLDFALSFQDLVRKSDGGDDSSDDAWSPAQSESPSDESNHSICSERSPILPNADTHHQQGDLRQFNVSYHKSTQRSTEKMSNSSCFLAQSHAIPGHAYVISENHSSQNEEDEGPSSQFSGDHNSNSNCARRTVKERRFKKSMSLPTSSGFRRHESRLEKYNTPDLAQNVPFMTVNDISLRTKPSLLPPPSRPPPVFAAKKGESEKPNPKLRASNSFGPEQLTHDSSLPFHNVEIDSSSSKMASVAMAIPIEKAQAKIRSAKVINEKKDTLQTGLKVQAQDCIEIMDEKMSKISNGANIHKDEEMQGTKSKEGIGMQPHADERKRVLEITEDVLNFIAGKKDIDLAENATERRGKECSSEYKISPKSEGTLAWRHATEYFEVVETGIPLKAVELGKDENNRAPSLGSDEHIHGVKSAIEASEQEEIIVQFRAAKEEPKLGEKNNGLELAKENCERGYKQGMSERTMESSCQKVHDKKVDVDAKKMVRANQFGVIKKLHNCDYKSIENLGISERNGAEVDVKQKSWVICEKIDPDRLLIDRKANERREGENFRTEECDERLEGDVERAESEKQEIGQEQRKEKQDESPANEEINKKEHEVCQRKANENVLNATIEQEDCAKKFKGSTEYEKSGNNITWTIAQEENERDQKLNCGREARKSKVMKAHNLTETEEQFNMGLPQNSGKRLSDACETGVNGVRFTDVWEQEQDKNGPTVAYEEEDIEESSRLTRASGIIHASEGACGHECGPTQDTEPVNWDKNDRMVYLDQGTCEPLEGENVKAFDGPHKPNDEMHKATVLHGKDQKLKTEFRVSEEVEARAANLPVDEKVHSFGTHQKHKIQIEGVTESPSLHGHMINPNVNGNDIRNSLIEPEKQVSQMLSDPGINKANTQEQGQRGKIMNGVQITSIKEIAKDKPMLQQVFMEWSGNGKKIGAPISDVFENRNTLNPDQRCASQNSERKERNSNGALDPKKQKTDERFQYTSEQEKEHLRRIAEEEREREREKDRMAVDRATLEARDRSYSDTRERAERAAVGRVTAKGRQRATVEARERLGKASVEARERSLADRESKEARLRAERAAVERATAEARQRAFEKAMAEKASFEARERVESTASDKFPFSSRNVEVRQCSSSSDLPLQGSGTADLFHSYSSTHAGVDSESPQRSKARLERYRRTAERAAKALAEKNMRDLLAQREQTERNRLAETLDAEVRRWSSGKEGNLRALLSTLQYILGPDCGWQPIPLTEVITSAAVKKAYRKATLCVHPDKLQQRGASIQQKYICEKVFDLLKEAWNTFNSEER